MIVSTPSLQSPLGMLHSQIQFLKQQTPTLCIRTWSNTVITPVPQKCHKGMTSTLCQTPLAHIQLIVTVHCVRLTKWLSTTTWTFSGLLAIIHNEEDIYYSEYGYMIINKVLFHYSSSLPTGNCWPSWQFQSTTKYGIRDSRSHEMQHNAPGNVFLTH